MERNITVEKINQTKTSAREVEIVERKGIGHPDSVADGIAEAVSRALSKYYIEHYGRILHHNTDQVEVVGGQAAPKFGGGMVLEPHTSCSQAGQQQRSMRTGYRTSP